MANAMLSIEIYKFNETWCFTDLKRELLHEPFVLGIPEIINEALIKQNLFKNNQNYRILFSSQKFPACHGGLKRLKSELGGAWYTWNKKEGWLCPATLKFFHEFPENIYFRLEPLSDPES